MSAYAAYVVLWRGMELAGLVVSVLDVDSSVSPLLPTWYAVMFLGTEIFGTSCTWGGGMQSNMCA